MSIAHSTGSRCARKFLAGRTPVYAHHSVIASGPTSTSRRASLRACARAAAATGQRSNTRTATVAEEITSVTTSYSDDPQLADKCVQTLSLALEGDASTSFWCLPGAGKLFYSATIGAAVRRSPSCRRIVSLNSGACAAVVYRYPEEQPAGDPAAAAGPGPSSSWPLLWRALVSLLSVQPGRWIEAWLVGDVFERQRMKFARAHGGSFTYLMVMGVQPGLQGRGMGSALLQHIVRDAEQQGRWVYVEASSSGSRKLYERAGFELLQSMQHRKEAPLTYLMARAPAPSSGRALQEEGQGSTSSRLGRVLACAVYAAQERGAPHVPHGKSSGIFL